MKRFWQSVRRNPDVVGFVIFYLVAALIVLGAVGAITAQTPDARKIERAPSVQMERQVRLPDIALTRIVDEELGLRCAVIREIQQGPEGQILTRPLGVSCLPLK